MAADVYGVVSTTELPYGWDYAVTSDGRVFFVNEYDEMTTWISPVTGEPVQSGHTTSLGLPRGWELGYTPEGVKYYIDHNQRLTTFTNPISGRPEALKSPNDYSIMPYKASRLDSQANPKFLTNSPITSKSKSAFGRITPKRGSVKKQSTTKKMDGPQARTRSLDAPVSMKGWLQKFESSPAGVRKWKSRFFVLQDFCLYTYKDAAETEIIDSILLPSYKISLHTKYNREFGFKAEHENTKTHYFAADHKDSLNNWMTSLRMASVMQTDNSFERDFNRTDGDGTDSPMVASPYHDQRSKDKYGPSSSQYNRSMPVASVRSPMGHRPHSLNVSRPSDLRSPPDRPDHRWSSPTGPANHSSGDWQARDGPVPYGDWQARDGPAPYSDWQVRDQYEPRDGPYMVERSYTPPVPQYNPDYEMHPPVGRIPSTPVLNTSNPNYEYQDRLDYPSQPALQQYMSNNRISQPYSPPMHAQYDRPDDYMMDRGSPGPPYDRTPVRGHAVLIAAHQPVISQAYRSPSSAYQSPYADYNHEQQLTSQPPLLPPYYPTRDEEDEEYDHRGKRGGHQPINFNQGYPHSVSKNNSNNTRQSSNDATFVNDAGQPAFKPPSNVKTHGPLTANDLVGKSQEELVLLLIELRREQSQLESSIEVATQRLAHAKIEIDRLQGRREDSYSIRRDMEALNDYIDTTEKQINIQKPLVQLVDNMVKMSSVYGGRNADTSSRHSKRVEGDKRRMMEFSRRLEEQQISKEVKASDRKLVETNPSGLDMKLEELYRSDREIQKASEILNVLRIRMKKVENDLMNVNNLLGQSDQPLYRVNQMMEERQRLEFELSQMRRQLSGESQQMEQLTTRNTGLQEEVMSMKSKLIGGGSTPRHGAGHGGHDGGRHGGGQAYRGGHTSRDLEKDVWQTQKVVNGLQKQSQSLSEAMSSLKVQHSSAASSDSQTGTYFETDIDTMKTRDLSMKQFGGVRKPADSPNNSQQSHGSPSVVHRSKPTTIRDMKRASASRLEHQRDLDRSSVQRQQSAPKFTQPLSHHSQGSPQQRQQRPVSACEPRTGPNPPPWQFNTPRFNMVRSSTGIDKDYTTYVIDHQLFTPQKVHIPERYVPDSSDEEEVMSPEEVKRRAEKAEQIRKMVASQSLQEFSRSEIDAPDDRVAQKVREEKKRREHVLEIRHAMAKEVTKKMQKMRSKSHENLSRPIESY